MHTKFWSENLKRQIREAMGRYEGNIRQYLREIGWEGVNWIHVT
jgi:hypothetical protein